MELLVVMAIIATLAAMTIAGLGIVKEKVKDKRTDVLINGLDNALEAYQLDNNEIPDGDGSLQSSIELYRVLYADYDLDGISDAGEEVYYEKLDANAKGGNLNVSREDGYIIIDAWQQPLHYQSPGEQNPDFDIWSFGPNNEGGPNTSPSANGDDIDNY